MAKLYVSEYPDLPGAYATWAPQVVRDPALVEQVPVVIGAGSLQSAAFSSMTKIVRLHTDVICSIVIGPPATATATANNQRMAANQTEYKMVIPGHVVAVITNT
jgi:hypothetical protein